MEKRRINVRGVIWHNDKLLAVKHLTESGSEADYWALPGGGLDPLESLEAGVQRELFEELGVTANVGRLIATQQFASTRKDRDEELEFFYLVENAQDFLAPNFTDTSHGAVELARVDFINPKTEYILPRFLSEIDLAKYASSSQPVLHMNYLDETPSVTT